MLALLVLSLWPRVFQLDSMLNIDAVLYWSKRIPAFWDGLLEADYKRTFQTHPGVTVMWLSGFFQRWAGVLERAPSHEFIVPAKLPLALLGSAIAPATFALLERILGRNARPAALVAGAALATEPFLVAQSRALHVDNTAMGFAWCAVLAGWIAMRETAWRWAVTAGACFGLAVLSRTTVLGIGLGFTLVAIGWILFSGARRMRRLWLLVVVGIVCCITVTLLWPSLLFHPLWTLDSLLERTGTMVAKGHRLFFLGKIYQRDPGGLYYLALWFTKTSPEAMLGFLATGCGLLFATKDTRRLIVGALLCYLPILIALVVSSKKGSRYLLPIFPLMITAAAVGVTDAVRWCSAKTSKIPVMRTALLLGLLAFGLRAARLGSLHPMPVAWCPEYPGLRCERVITMGGGQGLREIALFIKEHHPGKSVPRVYDTPYAKALRPWLRAKIVRRSKQADYFIRYLSERQRNVGVRAMRRHIRRQKPLITVQYDDITFAELFLGPHHPDYRRGGA